MTKEKWWLGKKGEWYVVVQFVLFALIALSGWFWQLPILDGARQGLIILTVVGGLLILSGMGLAFYGMRSLGKNLRAVPHPKEDGHLVATGAYRLVRHPIYSGAIFAALGWGLFANSWVSLLLAAALFFFFDRKSRQEELWLVQKYPAYGSYQQQVRKLIPFIY